ncbi:MAG: hypothetical protein AAF799_01640 [Myxococcota bacterium]
MVGCTRANPLYDMGIDTAGDGSSDTGTPDMDSSGVASEDSSTSIDPDPSASSGFPDDGGDGDDDDGGVEPLDAGTGAPAAGPCDRLELLFVVDTHGSSGAGRMMLNQTLGTLENVFLRNPAQPWHDDFRVGVVRASDLASEGPCANFGLHTMEVRDGEPCGSAVSPWVSQADGDIASTLSCLVTTADAPASSAPPPVALSAARGLGLEVPSDRLSSDQLAVCNDGFVRESSLKVVVILSARDEAAGDTGSPGTPEQWAEWFNDLQVPADGSRVVLVPIVPLGEGLNCVQSTIVLDWAERLSHDVPIDLCSLDEGWVEQLSAGVEAACE